MLQLSDVRVFLEILSTGSFTGAARALGMPKSSVARQVARLEEDVGGRLLHRTSRSVSLTDDGRSFVPVARRLLEDGIEAHNFLRRDGRDVGGRLAVTTTGLFGRTVLAPILPRFLQRYPKIQLSLRLTAGRVEIGGAPGEADVAIRLRTEGHPDVGSRKLGQIHSCLVAAPAYLAKKAAPESPKDLAGHDFIELGPSTKDHRMELERHGEVCAVRYTPALRIDDPEAVKVATAAGGGVSLLPTFLVADGLASGALVRLLPGWAPAPLPVTVLYRTDVATPMRVRLFVDFLFDTIGKDASWQA